MPGIGHSGSRLANDPGLNYMHGLALVESHPSRALLFLAVYKVLVLLGLSLTMRLLHVHWKKAKCFHKNFAASPSKMLGKVSTTVQAKRINLILI